METTMDIKHDRGRYEVEVSGTGETGLHQNLVVCEKNPGHPNFIPVSTFNIHHLPFPYRNPDIVKLAKAHADLTVRVSVNYISEDRPKIFPGLNDAFPFYHHKGTNKHAMYGSGWVSRIDVYTEDMNIPCKCEECRNSGHPVKRWGELWVYTAAHVVFDSKEAAHTTCHFFYDSPKSDPNTLPKLCGPSIGYADIKEDRCWMIYISHDMELVERLHGIWKNCEQLQNKVTQKYSALVKKNFQTNTEEKDQESDNRCHGENMNCRSDEVFSEWEDSQIDHSDNDIQNVKKARSSNKDKDENNNLEDNFQNDKHSFSEDNKEEKTCSVDTSASTETPGRASTPIDNCSTTLMDNSPSTKMDNCPPTPTESSPSNFMAISSSIQMDNTLIPQMANPSIPVMDKLPTNPIDNLFISSQENNPSFALNPKLTIITSHPHGCSKHITVGYWTDRRETEFNMYVSQYTYTTPTCPGSSGGHVYMLGTERLLWCDHPHSGQSEIPGLNMSGGGYDHKPSTSLQLSLREYVDKSKRDNLPLQHTCQYLVELARDEEGSRFIQKQLDDATEDEINMVVERVSRTYFVMTHMYGHGIIEKLLDIGSKQQTSELADKMMGRVLPLSFTEIGSKVVRKALQRVPDGWKLATKLKEHVVDCLKDHFASQVLVACLETLDIEHLQFIIDAVKNKVYTLSTQQHGSLIVTSILHNCPDDIAKGVLEELKNHVAQLSRDKYGHKVIESALHTQPAHPSPFVIHELQSALFQLSKHQYGSNVVQAALKLCKDKKISKFMDDIHRYSRDLMCDKFGNRVIQCVLDVGGDENKSKMCQVVKENLVKYSRHGMASRVVKLCLDRCSKQERVSLIQELVNMHDENRYQQTMYATMTDISGNDIILKMLEVAAADDWMAFMKNIRTNLKKLEDHQIGRQFVFKLRRQLLQALERDVYASRTLEDFRGHLVAFSSNELGARWMQQKIQSASKQEIDIVHEEILPQTSSLATHKHGNLVIQTLIRTGTCNQQQALMYEVTGQSSSQQTKDEEGDHLIISYQLLECLRDRYGQKVIQTLIEFVDVNNLQLIFDVITYQIHNLATHKHASQVIQSILKHCPQDVTYPIVENLIPDILDIAQNQYGGQVVASMLQYSSKDKIISVVRRICKEGMNLACHQYGHHVVMGVIQHCKGEDTDLDVHVVSLLKQLEIHKADLCKHKHGNKVFQCIVEHCTKKQKVLFLNEIQTRTLELVQHVPGSNVTLALVKHGNQQEQNTVVEKLQGQFLKFAQHENAFKIVQAILENCGERLKEIVFTELRDNFLSLAQDEYGCSIVRCVLSHCQLSQRKCVVKELQHHVVHLAQHDFGCLILLCVLDNLSREFLVPIFEELYHHVLQLSLHCNGCDVIMYVLDHGTVEDKKHILQNVLDNFGTLIKNAFGSDVVLKCLATCGDEKQALFVQEICQMKDNHGTLLQNENSQPVLIKLFQEVNVHERQLLTESLKLQDYGHPHDSENTLLFVQRLRKFMT